LQQQQQPYAREDLQQQQHVEQPEQQDSSHESSSSSSSSLTAAEVTAPLLLLNNSVEGSSLRAKRKQLGSPGRLASAEASSVRSRRLKKVHNGVSKAPPADAVAHDAVQPVASRSLDGGHSGSKQ
jgi:hypothetical protein